MLTALLIIRSFLSILSGPVCSQSDQDSQFEKKIALAYDQFLKHPIYQYKISKFSLKVLLASKATALEKVNGEQMRKKASYLKREAANVLTPAWAQ